jgi:hypothetical protein
MYHVINISVRRTLAYKFDNASLEMIIRVFTVTSMNMTFFSEVFRRESEQTLVGYKHAINIATLLRNWVRENNYGI